MYMQMAEIALAGVLEDAATEAAEERKESESDLLRHCHDGDDKMHCLF